jgi:capsule polysaccharide export protein KpsC/LpsZ
VLDYLDVAFPSLPDNIRVVPPDSDLSSYGLIELADLVLTYTSTIGLEAAICSKPVLVGGMTHYRGKGFTMDDPKTKEGYFRTVHRVLLGESQYDRLEPERARRYAYMFFGRYMVPFRVMDQSMQSSLKLQIDSIRSLKKHHDSNLNAVCDFILESQGDLEKRSLILGN